MINCKVIKFKTSCNNLGKPVCVFQVNPFINTVRKTGGPTLFHYFCYYFFNELKF